MSNLIRVIIPVDLPIPALLRLECLPTLTSLFERELTTYLSCSVADVYVTLPNSTEFGDIVQWLNYDKGQSFARIQDEIIDEIRACGLCVMEREESQALFIGLYMSMDEEGLFGCSNSRLWWLPSFERNSRLLFELFMNKACELEEIDEEQRNLWLLAEQLNND